jgi:hypothetical protein
MPKHSSQILKLARKGAEARLHELETEIAAIAKIFPHLEFGSAVSPSMPDAVEQSVQPKVRRRNRRKMSAAARKAVSVRMKKYWAERKAGAKTK